MTNAQKSGVVVLAGGSGLIGSHLRIYLQENGYECRILSRHPDPSDPQAYFWDPNRSEMDETALEGNQFIINLAGAGIADKRWTSSRKKTIIESRTLTTQFLYAKCYELDQWPELFIGSSAIGYYGDRPGEQLTENSKPGAGFLSTSVIHVEESILYLGKKPGTKCQHQNRHCTQHKRWRLTKVDDERSSWDLQLFRKRTTGVQLDTH